MARIAAFLFCSCLTVAPVARGGEEEIKPRKKKTTPPAPRIDSRTRPQYESGIARYPVAAIVKVVEAGVIVEDKNRPQFPEDRRHSWRMQQFGVRAQRVRCEVIEPIRGLKKTEKKIEILVRHLDVYSAQRRLRAKDPKRMQPKVEEAVAEAGFFTGEKYLVLLAVDENVKPGKKRKGPVYTTVQYPLFGAPEAMAKIYRAMAGKIRLYQNPPVATKEQLAAAEKHLKSLESTTYVVREQAHEGLLKIGAAITKRLKSELAKTKDLEVRLRCSKLIDDMKPIPGGTEADWAGDFIIKKVEEKQDDEEEEKGGEAVVQPLPAK